MKAQPGRVWGKVGWVAVGVVLLLGGCVTRSQSAPGRTWKPVYSPGRAPKAVVEAPPAEAPPAAPAESTADSVYTRPAEVEPPAPTETPPASAEGGGRGMDRKLQQQSGKQTVDDLLGTGKGKGKKKRK